MWHTNGFRRLIPTSALALLGTLACADGITDTAISTQFAKGASGALGGSTVTECPTPADFVATDEASLRAGIAAASPGDVIGLDGFFGIARDIYIRVPDLTITCATPGSGLTPACRSFTLLQGRCPMVD